VRSHDPEHTFFGVIYHPCVCIQQAQHAYRILNSWKAQTACEFNCHIETEGLLKVTGNHVHRKRDNISKTVQDGDAVNMDH